MLEKLLSDKRLLIALDDKISDKDFNMVRSEVARAMKEIAEKEGQRWVILRPGILSHIIEIIELED